MLVSLGIIDKKILIPLCFPIFIKLRRFINDKSYAEIKNPFFKVFCNFVNLSLGGVLYLILLYKLKVDKKKKENKIDQVKNLSNAYLLVKKNQGEDQELIDLSESDSEDPIEKEQKRLKKKKIEKNIFLLF